MIGAIVLTVALGVTITTTMFCIVSENNIRETSYKRGYNDSIRDLDEILDNYSSNGVESIGIETMRNRIAEEYLI